MATRPDGRFNTKEAEESLRASRESAEKRRVVKARDATKVIENRQRAVGVRIRPLEKFLRQLRREVGIGPESVAVRLIDDREMARLNESYRHKKGPTDVLSFAEEELSKPAALARQVKKARGKFLGDIAIAPKVAGCNAKSLGRTLPEELKVLILHGVLHLLGYDHETDRGEMERIEMRLRRRLGIA